MLDVDVEKDEADEKPRRAAGADAGVYEPRIVAGKLMMPAELQRIHSLVVDSVVVETISDEMRAVVESLWPELAHKLPSKS
jgi:hypothetical protein